MLEAQLRSIFPEIWAATLFAKPPHSTLPEKAPKRWDVLDKTGETGRIPGEHPPQFIKRVYAPWLGHGLTRPDIRRLDLKLYQALATWTNRHGELDFELPTKNEDMRRWVDAVGAQEAHAEMRELSRRAGAIRRRVEKGGI